MQLPSPKAVLRILPPRSDDPYRLKQYGVYYTDSKQLVKCKSYQEAAAKLNAINSPAPK